MTKRGKTILLVVIGAFICVGIIGVATVAWLVTSAFESTAADESSAVQSFDEIRRRFGGSEPILEMRDNVPVLVRRPPDTAPARALTDLHVLTWDPDGGQLSTITLPFWLLRLKDDPIEVALEAGGTHLPLTLQDIERYGPALFLDYVDEDGDRVLAWTE